MSAPTKLVRAATYARDESTCYCCGRRDQLSFQHRQASGMGGSKVRPTLVEGLTACSICNGRFEAELQTMALRFGWKVPRWVRDCSRVPVYSNPAHQWFGIAEDGATRYPVSDALAQDMMREIYGEGYEVAHASA